MSERYLCERVAWERVVCENACTRVCGEGVLVASAMRVARARVRVAHAPTLCDEADAGEHHPLAPIGTEPLRAPAHRHRAAAAARTTPLVWHRHVHLSRHLTSRNRARRWSRRGW